MTRGWVWELCRVVGFVVTREVPEGGATPYESLPVDVGLWIWYKVCNTNVRLREGGGLKGGSLYP